MWAENKSFSSLGVPAGVTCELNKFWVCFPGYVMHFLERCWKAGTSCSPAWVRANPHCSYKQDAWPKVFTKVFVWVTCLSSQMKLKQEVKHQRARGPTFETKEKLKPWFEPDIFHQRANQLSWFSPLPGKPTWFESIQTHMYGCDCTKPGVTVGRWLKNWKKKFKASVFLVYCCLRLWHVENLICSDLYRILCSHLLQSTCKAGTQHTCVGTNFPLTERAGGTNPWHRSHPRCKFQMELRGCFFLVRSANCGLQRLFALPNETGETWSWLYRVQSWLRHLRVLVPFSTPEAGTHGVPTHLLQESTEFMFPEKDSQPFHSASRFCLSSTLAKVIHKLPKYNKLTHSLQWIEQIYHWFIKFK